MAIAVLPPVSFTPDESADITTLSTLIGALTTILDNQSALCSEKRQLSDDAISSLNNTITDASDRIDAIINPASS